VLADLYLPEESGLDAAGLPGLERLARFGRRTLLAEGWRAWLARAAGRTELAAQAPASVAALCSDEIHGEYLWLATPVHLLAGLTSLHLEQRGLLRLPMPTLRVLAEDFSAVFSGAGFSLVPLASGGFLAVGPASCAAATREPARCIGQDIGAALPASPALRRLGAEMELWLHAHPVNLARGERGELPISTLWLWGGGPPCGALAAATDQDAHLFGSDPYVDGLASANGVRAAALPNRVGDLLAATAQRVVIVLDLANETAGASFNVGAALAALDARWILPAIKLAARGRIGSLRLLANDRCLSFTRSDHLRFWRPARRGLAGLA